MTEFNLDIAEYALRCASKHADFVDVRIERSTSNGFLMKNGIIEASSFEEVIGIGARVLVKGTLGFACTNIMEKDSIKKMVSSAIKDAKRFSAMNNRIRLCKGKPYSATYSVKEKIPLADVGPEERLEVLFDIEKRLTQSKVDMPFRYFSLSDSIDDRYYANSEGSRIRSTIPRINFYYFLTLSGKGGGSQRYWQYGKTSGFEAAKKFDFPKIVSDDALSMKNNMEKGVKPPKGKVDVVVGPQVTGIMVHESGGHPYEADRILGREAAQAGESFVSKNSFGAQIGSEAVNIIDDPTIPESFGFYLYDDEGVKAARKHILKKGRIAGFLHSRETAAAMNMPQNSSGRASSYDREPIARMSNTFMDKGDFSEEELISGVKKGIYMKNFTEWNIDDKRVNQKYVGAEAFLIKNGQISKPIIKPTIEISTFALYKSIDAAADNVEYHAGTCGKGEPMQALPVWFGGPSIRIRNIRLK